MNILNKWKDNISKFMKWTSEFIALNLEEENIRINYLISFSLREKDKFKTNKKAENIEKMSEMENVPCKWTNCKIFSLEKNQYNW